MAEEKEEGWNFIAMVTVGHHPLQGTVATKLFSFKLPPPKGKQKSFPLNPG